jgi:alpha-ketoglutarate-dependent taurine dioxygenase
MPDPQVRDHRPHVMEELSRDGFLVIDGCDTKTAEELAASLGSAGQWQTLVARRAEDADPWSLSGVYGLGEFPWHTDGVVATSPPRFLGFYCESAARDAAPTELLDLAASAQFSLTQRLAKLTLQVTDRSKRSRYLPALRRQGSTLAVRWDTRVAAPTDSLSGSEVIESLRCAPPTISIPWLPSRVLFIDNHRILHRRPAIGQPSARILKRIYVY